VEFATLEQVDACQVRVTLVLSVCRVILNPGLAGRVSDPDTYWIRIQSGQWIRIRIRDPDPDPGGEKSK
jgi:hypothetical protein